MILRLLLLSIASEGLYLLLSRESSRDTGLVEETLVFYGIWAALFLIYGLAVRTASRKSGRALLVFVFLTSALFRGTLLWQSGLDRSVPHVFLQGSSPLRTGAQALVQRLGSEREWPIEPEALAVTLFELGSLALAPGLLRAASLPAGLVLVQGWNPLLVKEVSGNARIEAGLLFFLFLAFRLAQRRKPTLAALAYGVSLTGPILGLWATLPLMARVLRLRLGISALVAGSAWALTAGTSPSWLELVGWPPASSLGGSVLPLIATVSRLFVSRNELVPLAIASGLLLFVASFRVYALRPDWGTLPREALTVAGFSLLLAPQTLPWSFLPIAALAAFSTNRGWLLFTATAPLTYLGLGRGWNFWVGFTQYFPPCAASIYIWLGTRSERKGERRSDRSKSPGRSG